MYTGGLASSAPSALKGVRRLAQGSHGARNATGKISLTRYWTPWVHFEKGKFTVEEAKLIKGKVLVCHGADDKFIPAESIAGFKKALGDAKVSLDFQEYKGAVHSFTVPGADKHKIPGMAFNKEADDKSWASMKALFADAFKK